MNNLTADVVVIGLGAMGSAATYQLAKAGVDVVGIDQFHPPHSFGSTHGETRITRESCHEGPEYTVLSRRSMEIWRELEQKTDQELLRQNGYLLLSEPDSPAIAHGFADPVGRAVDVANLQSVNHETLTTDQIHQRFPMFQGLRNEKAYFESAGGILFPESCVQANLEQAKVHGAELLFDTAVTDWQARGNDIAVITKETEILTKQIIVAAGPWMKTLHPDSIGRHVKLHRQVLHWFAVPEENLDEFQPERMPVYIWNDESTKSYYGFPVVDQTRGLKLANEQYDVETSDADNVDRNVTPEEIDEVREFVSRHFPVAANHYLNSAVCIYTDTSDYGFIIDWHPEHDNVLVISACSGHGFKHSAAIGEMTRDLVTTGKSSLWSEQFSLGRFNSLG